MARKNTTTTTGTKATSAVTTTPAISQAAPTKTAKKDERPIVVQELRRRLLVLPVRGTSPLIVHAWDEKAKQQMRDKQQGRASPGKKAPKNPQELIEGCKYKDKKGRDCVPAVAFKNAIVTAARYADGIQMTFLRGAIFVKGTTTDARGNDLIPLTYESITNREDMVRVGQGTADMRYRPQYNDWSVDLPIEFDEAVISAEIVVNLVRRAGFSVGICEWRPERDGRFGQFDLADAATAEGAPKRRAAKRGARAAA